MSCGVPVLITQRGGPPEFVRDGENGYLLEPADTGAWIARCDALLADASLRQRIGQAGRATAVADYALPAVVGRYERLFAELMQSKVD